MESSITKRIVTESGIPRLFMALAEDLSPSDLQSLLIGVYQKRARALKEAAPRVLARHERSPLFAPSEVDARLIHAFDRVAFAEAQGFEAIELSPVSPLGTSYALGGIDQNNVLTTIRNAEVLGDSTLAMALECARRRRRQRRAPVRLASSHRVIRLQPFDVPGYSPHFRLFTLVSAGRDTGSSSFEVQHLGEHIRFYLRFFRALNGEGFSLTKPAVEVSDVGASESLLAKAGVSREEVRQMVRAHHPGSSGRFLAEREIELPTDEAFPAVLEERLIAPLRAEFPEASFRYNLARLEGLGYYTGLSLRISPATSEGVRHAIVDGGFTDWTARLLEDRKERLLTSGIGTEFACRSYRA
jgi:hypothetical protein